MLEKGSQYFELKWCVFEMAKFISELDVLLAA